MDRTDLIQRLSEQKLAHFESRGLSPVKSKQLVAEKMATWKTLTAEQLERILKEDEAEY